MTSLLYKTNAIISDYILNTLTGIQNWCYIPFELEHNNKKRRKISEDDITKLRIIINPNNTYERKRVTIINEPKYIVKQHYKPQKAKIFDSNEDFDFFVYFE